MYYINEEENRVLEIIAKKNAENKKITFYDLAQISEIETNQLIPVIYRLEEEGYISSSGIIQRYLAIAEKGKAELKKKS